MSITDELRRFANGSDWIGCTASVTARKMLDVADRIDTEHEKHIASVMNDALYHANEMGMADLGWIRLPKDADGVPIHVGDFVEEYNTRTVEKARGEVIRIVYGKHATDIRIDTGTCYADRNPYNVRHVAKPPTVEDALREFALACEDAGNAGPEVAELIEQYAAKLQLKA